jgi:hypothetical protein
MHDSFLLQMDLTQRFKDVAAIKNILYPTLETNRIYPIRKVQLVYHQIILLFIFDIGIESVVVLNNSYSFALTEDDIDYINYPSEFYPLMYKKKIVPTIIIFIILK